MKIDKKSILLPIKRIVSISYSGIPNHLTTKTIGKRLKKNKHDFNSKMLLGAFPMVLIVTLLIGCGGGGEPAAHPPYPPGEPAILPHYPLERSSIVRLKACTMKPPPNPA